MLAIAWIARFKPLSDHHYLLLLGARHYDVRIQARAMDLHEVYQLCLRLAVRVDVPARGRKARVSC